jgi:hypothetical protein
MIPLPIQNRKPPNLLPRPPLLLIIDKALDMPLPSRATILLFSLKPFLLQKLIRDFRIIDRNPTRLAGEVAEQVVGVRAGLPVEFTDFGGALDAAGRGLLDINVGVPVVSGVLFAVQGDGREGDGFAGYPADALEGEDGVGVVGEGFVLVGVLGCCFVMERDLPTITHSPERSFIVISGGAAILWYDVVYDVLSEGCFAG